MTRDTAKPSRDASTRLEVAESGQHLVRQDRPVFLLADTLWAAFSRMTDHEWFAALRLRRRQGFNAINISVLPVAHDRSLSADATSPFLVRSDGSADLNRLDLGYFQRARKMVQTAQQLGFAPVLAALWCNYVPNTWGSQRTPDLAMDDKQTQRYLDVLLDTFADLKPIFCISGDDSLDDPVALSRYRSALHQVKGGAPLCLTTMHSTPSAFLPPGWSDDPGLDLYAYQAGHDDGWEQRSLDLPERYADVLPRKPIFSMEPCYEGHGFGSGRARHDARDVRRASWSGLLAGAGAGLGYAAHGAWSWHRSGEAFNGEHFSGIPLPADRAMQLPGAWDVGLLRRVVETHGLYDLRSRQDLVVDDRSGTRFAVSPAHHDGADFELAVAFLPHAFPLQLDFDLSGWTVETWDLSQGRRDHVAHTRVQDLSVFDQPDVNDDLVYVMSHPRHRSASVVDA